MGHVLSNQHSLIGDVIHTMTPGRGVGANTAPRVAALLCQRLTATSQGHLSLIDAVAGYESQMRQLGFEAVRQSREQMDASGVIHKPIAGRLALAGMRTGMRIANHLPPIKRCMAEGLLREHGAERDQGASGST